MFQIQIQIFCNQTNFCFLLLYRKMFFCTIIKPTISLVGKDLYLLSYFAFTNKKQKVTLVGNDLYFA